MRPTEKLFASLTQSRRANATLGWVTGSWFFPKGPLVDRLIKTRISGLPFSRTRPRETDNALFSTRTAASRGVCIRICTTS